MKKIIVTLLFVITGCATVVKTNNKFDPEEFKAKLNAKGVNTIAGSALIRQLNGGVVTCAGQRVALIPVTAYSIERFNAIYGNDIRGFNPVGKKFKFEPDYPEYTKLQKETICDAQGFFSFTEISDGDYFVVTGIVWQINAYRWDGGGLFERVSIKDGKSIKITLAP